MMIVSEGDNITCWDLEIDAFNTIPSPVKKLFIIPEVTHMTLYTNRNKLEIAAEAGRDWFVEHLIRPYE